MNKRIKIESACHDHVQYEDFGGSRQSGVTTYLGRSSINNASCDLSDEYFIEQMLTINQKCDECVEAYRKHSSIIENQKTAYAYAEKMLRSKLDKTNATLKNLNEYKIDQNTDIIWKFIVAIEHTKMLLAKEHAKYAKSKP